MKLKLSIGNRGYLMFDTTAAEKEYDLTEQELEYFSSRLLKLYKNKDGTIRKEMVSDEIIAEVNLRKVYSNRKAEYPTIEEMTVALWEAIVEGRPETKDILEAKRQEVKLKYPKPE